jgi:N6-adenosine-specific RNA methylase IME4
MRDAAKPLTGYQLYSREQRRRAKKQPIAELYPPLPSRQYQVIYADPPWDYNGKLQFDKTSVAKDRLDPSRGVFISSAQFKYPTLTLPELQAMPILQIADNDCLLFLWSTNPHLAQAMALGHSWGFEYKTVAFVWNKMVHNPGQYTLSNCELCLLFKRGRIPRPRGARNIQQLVNSPRRKHSMKPDVVRQNIEKMFPAQSRIELFARDIAPGWDGWGLEALCKQSDKLLFK